MSLSFAASNISKGYSGNQILRDCSFAFDRSGIYVLTGPNGCGKSTFLRSCALLESPDSGEVTYLSDGRIIQKDISLRRRITLVLPRVGIFNTTVSRNVAYGLRVRGLPGREIEEAVSHMLDFVGLSHKKDQNALTLSSGETQRVGIARALAIEPEILFLDEPTASVDETNTEIIEDIICSLKMKKTTIMILTTHDRSQAERLADRMLTIKDKTLVEI